LLTAALATAAVLFGSWWWALRNTAIEVPEGQQGNSAGVAFRLDTLEVITPPEGAMEDRDAYAVVRAQLSYQGAADKLVGCLTVLVGNDVSWSTLGDPDTENDIPDSCNANGGQLEVMFLVPVTSVADVIGVRVDVWQEPSDSRVMGRGLISHCSKAETCDARDGARHADLLLLHRLG
jgi:hypothetical protein